MKTFQNTYKTILTNPIRNILIYAVLVRVLVFIFYNAITIFPDTEDYINLATYIGNLNLFNYTGERTPGFPFLIALTGQNLHLVVFFQVILGVVNTYLLYDFCWVKTKSKDIAFITAVITTSFLSVVFYEFAILTESLTYTLMILAFWYIEKYKLLHVTTSIKHVIILSLIFSALYLTRPLFIYFPLGYFLYFVFKNFKVNLKSAFLKSAIILIIPFISFYSWSSLNKHNIGYFTSSYYLGINLAQTATSFFEKAPDEHQVIRDIFVKHRNYVVKNEPYHKYPMTVWYAYDELITATNLSPPDLSHELGEISINLFKEHPDQYSKQVFISWKDFWGGTSTLLWNVDKFEYKVIRKGLVGLWNYIQKPLLILINILFLIFAFKKILTALKQKLRVLDYDLFLVLIILSGSLAQALVAYGTNSRFCFPYFALIVYFVMTNLFSFKNSKS
ncbi:glycosyltransferase family protein [Hanstruepera ponticola]|uniref:glycosyltransferase family 39 protein n=1 Tax=Hanstruepera ponticola TaxID=2042995 RepID=UPI001785B7BE|nr:glycosyltransferase family 39 protein [Hanstruepera ponticola]